MNNLLVIAIAILPVVLLGVFVFRQDKKQKEPLGQLLKAFFFGSLSILPAALMEAVVSCFTPEIPVLEGLFTGFCVAGCCEEFCKLMLLLLAVWGSRYFDEYFDGIVYATFLSLGFACFENLGYVFGQETLFSSLVTGTMRAILSVPGHFLFGVAMGYYLALAKFDKPHRARYLLLAFFVPMLLHGTFDSLLMIPESMGSGASLVAGTLFVVFIVFDIILWKKGMRRIRKMQELTRQQGFDWSNPFAGFQWD